MFEDFKRGWKVFPYVLKRVFYHYAKSPTERNQYFTTGYIEAVGEYYHRFDCATLAAGELRENAELRQWIIEQFGEEK